MSNISISDLKPAQSKYEEICDSQSNSIIGGGLYPYVKGGGTYSFSTRSFDYKLEVGIRITFNF